ncbi:MAG: TnpV protein [Ruminococcus sp.]|jgi:hypothetical protein|nr:TnpV protein [Ruminococcus sp.]
MEKMARQITENGIDYVLDEATETYLPDLKVEPTEPIGKYGRLRKKYLKDYHSPLYQAMMIKGTLDEHLAEIDRTANKYLDRIIKGMVEADGLTEEMKNTDMLRWVGLMNNYKACAEEIILHELIYDG